MGDVDDRLILICAFRYALGRATYMPGVVASRIIRDWDIISDGDRDLFKREIKEAIQHDMAGMDCDVYTWEKILELP